MKVVARGRIIEVEKGRRWSTGAMAPMRSGDVFRSTGDRWVVLRPWRLWLRGLLRL